jgi:hypothetical protein
MRKIFTAFLILLMVTPGLACGPFLGAAKAQAAQVSMPGMPDCKGMGMGNDQKKAGDGGDHVFFKDCAKVDLSGVDHTILKAPDFGGKIFFIASAATTPDYSFTPASDNTIRGPPPDWPGLYETQPSILLTTQRFRV